jgi:hypothetical protein
MFIHKAFNYGLFIIDWLPFLYLNEQHHRRRRRRRRRR